MESIRFYLYILRKIFKNTPSKMSSKNYKLVISTILVLLVLKLSVPNDDN